MAEGRRWQRRSVALSLVAAGVLGACELGEPVRVRPTRERTGIRDVDAAQRDIDRTLLEYQRQRDQARRDAMRQGEE
jgi:hypothetical protein